MANSVHPQNKRLFDWFSPLFRYGVELKSGLHGSEPFNKPVDVVHEEVRKQLESIRQTAQSQGKRERDINEAAFAVVAWLDEIIGTASDWSGGATPLQVQEFGTSHAGEEFFAHLKDLTAEQAEVREVYFAALGLGFVGMHFMETGDGGELARLKEYHGRMLPVSPILPERLVEDRITPQPYSREDPPAIRIKAETPAPAQPIPERPAPAQASTTVDIPRKKPKLAAGTIGLIAAAGAVGLWLVTRDAEKPPEPAIAIDSVALQSAVQGAGCGALSVKVGSGGKVQLEGVLSEFEDKNALVSKLTAMPGVKAVTTKVKSVPLGLCEVIRTVSPFSESTPSGTKEIVLSTPGKSEARYREGEKLALNVSVAKPGSYLYVDYYSTDGNVVHMLPNPIERNNKAPASGVMVIGSPPFNREYPVSGPFGKELIVAVSSSVPLFAQARGEVEEGGAYNSALRRELKDGRDGVYSSYMFIVTEPTGSSR